MTTIALIVSLVAIIIAAYLFTNAVEIQSTIPAAIGILFTDWNLSGLSLR